MGKKAKSSRKGKKAWRANISTEDFEEYFEKSTKDALSGGSLADIPSDSLYFLDKTRDLSVKRKIEKSRERVLHCDSVLQRNPFVQPVPSSIQKKKKSKKNGNTVRTDETDVDDCSRNETAADSGIVDLWEEKGEDIDIARIRRKPKPSLIPAVEVEPSGCSFNPHPDTHQEALARAVADEMHKIYQHELGPEPVPLLVPGQAIDEEDIYFLETDHGIDDKDDGQSENIIDYEDTNPEKRLQKTKRVTRVELNRRLRQKERLKVEAETKKVGVILQDIDRLRDILEEITEEDKEKHKRHIRRNVAKQERLKTRPPRMGKYKFEPAPLQVLLSEEKTGSLRKLKGCCTLARDRFKSLEKRGLVIPSKKSGRK
ncbi:ribosome biogenesis protein NOP53-like isoform X1 [Primulina huaijiensis]|uniref:ribosome biogenesis protein NOP53-like isoform X1 n=1 Tax=Primulina huaijiensis TaxID=1492673 RepID=UPI003CC6F61E